MAEEHFDAVVDVRADTSAATVEIKALDRRLDELKRTQLLVRADTSRARAQINDLKRQVEAGADFGLDTSRARAGIKALQREVRDLSSVKLRVDADTLAAKAQLASLSRSAGGDTRLKAKVETDSSGLQQLIRNAGDLNRSLSRLPTPLLATAGAAAALTVAFGATAIAATGVVGVVGVLGAVALKENTKVKEAYQSTAGFIGERFTQMSEQLVPSFARISSEARKSFERITPDINRIIAATGPAIEGLSEAAGSFAEEVTPGFRALAEASGPVIEGLKDFAANVGGAVNQLLTEMADTSEGAGAGLKLLGDGTSLVISQLSDFVNIANTATASLGALRDGLKAGGGDDDLLNQVASNAVQAANPLNIVSNLLDSIRKAGREGLDPNVITGRPVANEQAKIEAQNKLLSDAELSRKRLLDLQQQSLPLAQLDATKFQARVDAALTGYENLKESAKGLTQAELSESSTRVHNARSEASARRSVASAAQGVRDAQEAGLRQIAAAERAVADAQHRTRDAQEALTQSRKDAARAIVDMQRTLRDLPDTEEAARLRLARAQLNLEQAGINTGMTQEQADALEQDVKRREALLELKNAQEDVNDAVQNGAQTRQDAAELERQGIEGAPSVLAAKEALKAALQGQADAERNLGQTRVDAARSVQAANEALTVASEQLNQTLETNAIRAQEAAARTQEMREKAQKARVDADLLAASMGLTTDQLRTYSDNAAKIPTLALKMAGESEIISALDAVTIKARGIQLLALNPTWTAEKATETAAAEITGKKTIETAIAKLRDSTRAMFQFRADGGEIFGPGTSRSDSVPVMASRGEFMQPADSVQHYGRDFMEAVRRKRFPKFASGGMIDFPLADMRGIIRTMEEGGLYQRVRENAAKAAAQPRTPVFAQAGPAPTGALAEWIAAAIRHTGVGDSWTGPLNTLIMRESGGNPLAINNWDSNAQRGDPSRGLMQTIGSTFNSYRDRSLSDNIYDPISNIVAGINYIRARYGSIFNVQQANASAPPQGYKEGGLIFDEGGVLPTGKSVVDNRTGKPEPLLRTDKSIDLSTDTIVVLTRMLAQVLASRPAVMTLPNGRVLAETVSESQMSDITISGVTR